jgi:hypothetical protein
MELMYCMEGKPSSSYAVKVSTNKHSTPFPLAPAAAPAVALPIAATDHAPSDTDYSLPLRPLYETSTHSSTLIVICAAAETSVKVKYIGCVIYIEFVDGNDRS